MAGKDRHWRDAFELTVGTLLGCSYDHPRRDERLTADAAADLALVLYDHDDPGFANWSGSRAAVCRRHYWPTLCAPPDEARLHRLVRELVDAAAAGKRVEVFCFGGHGRTGTVLACAAVLTGEDPRAAVSRVRAQYCARAISTPELEDFVLRSASAADPRRYAGVQGR